MATRKRKPKQGGPPNTAPDKPAATGDRDPVTGQWLPGNRGNPNGRPKGIDFRRLVMEKLGEAAVEDVLLDVFTRLAELVRGKRGDVQAAKLILDRICEKPDAGDDEDEAQRLTPDQRRAVVLKILGLDG